MPLCGFLTFQCDLPSAGFHSLCAIQPEFRNLCGIYGGVSAIYIMQQYILQKYTKFRLIHFGSVLNYRYRSIQAQVNNLTHFSTEALLKKAQGVCRGGAALRPLCGFHFYKKILRPVRQERNTAFFQRVFLRSCYSI